MIIIRQDVTTTNTYALTTDTKPYDKLYQKFREGRVTSLGIITHIEEPGNGTIEVTYRNTHRS